MNNYPATIIQEKIRVRGTVQGVGFRPTVYRLAKACGLKGEVCNDGQGVLIRVLGSSESVDEFVQLLQQECPPLAKIEAINRSPDQGDLIVDDFVITKSINSSVRTEIAPDAATCPQCQSEIFDPLSRWYGYPFTNCTHCGPRLSIIKSIPYDRSNTSMAVFTMCPGCTKEYQDVINRRFHAQPIACPVCGPKVWLATANDQQIVLPDLAKSNLITDEITTFGDLGLKNIKSQFPGNSYQEATQVREQDFWLIIDTICHLIAQGAIVAIKGLGGIHLACDATNETAVQKLRSRKQRDHKPFALMARDLAVIAAYCHINQKEKQLLETPAAPIVLLARKEEENSSISPPNFRPIAPSVAPGQSTLGFMLPYTPLHHLILQKIDYPIILTSGNIADEPQCIDNQEAVTKLGQIADYFLLHNRDIINRIDDSVVRVRETNSPSPIQILRRARGYAPAPINLPAGFASAPHILAMGSELKNTFCLLRDGQAILSQHLGDLENAAAFNAYQDTLNLYLNLFDHQPVAIAIDQHPEYLASKLGQEVATANQLKLYATQHHHAHIAACMAENGIPLDAPPILGIACDGLGYGTDGTIWGGEFLLADYRRFKRLGTFKPVAMIGGEQAIYQPWRNTYAQLISAFNWDDLSAEYGDLELWQFLDKKPRHLLNQLIEKRLNSPLASSVGRLFDAVAAAIGICREECSYEGQAAIEMVAIVEINKLNNYQEMLGYPFKIGKLESRKKLSEPDLFYIEPQPMWQALLEDLKRDISLAAIAAKFHQGLANAIAAMVKQLSHHNFSNQVALSGGVFQNQILLQKVTTQLTKMGITVLTHNLVPPNDGGLSLGQAAIAAAQYQEGKRNRE